jgi:hypothetical protein
MAGVLMSDSACNEFVTWQEEVQLADGRVILVEQKKRDIRIVNDVLNRNDPKRIPHESWLTINLPEFSAQPIVWHQYLTALVLNIDDGRLYIVGIPPTVLEFHMYADPKQYYVSFLWENETWIPIPVNRISERIYTSNMLIDKFPPNGTSLLTLEKKNSRELNGSLGHYYGKRRLEPTHTHLFSPGDYAA